MILKYALAILAVGMNVAAIGNAQGEPPYTIVHAEGAIEIRDYAPMILAETEVSGDMATAGNRGFRPLANFIFGDNQRRGNEPGTGIAMTEPVLQSRSEKIAMTSPVTQTLESAATWRVAFIMPPEWSMDTLPRPNDPNVALREIPARRMAAIGFSGGADAGRFERKTAELSDFLAKAGYVAVGMPVYARYDPPWVPPPMRRNEVMIEIER